MAEAEESKEEYYIRLLTFVIGPATEVLQLYFEIKVLNSILEMFVEEQKSTLESFANQTRNLVEHTQTEMLSLRQEIKDFNVGIRNVVFEVKTLWKDELSKEKDSFTKRLSLDDDVCYADWKLSTPRKWIVDEIKKTLEKFSSLMGKIFRIVFVHKGSLIIQTLSQLRFLKTDDEFQLAIKSFLKDFLDICNVDTDTKTIVQVQITISMDNFESKYFFSEKRDTLWLTCDPCFNKKVILKAIQFCSECQYKLCRECIANHNMNEVYLTHHLTDIETLSLENFCTIHKGRILDFFCVVHDCLCCLSCKTDEHNSCQDVLPLEDAAKNVEHSVMFQDLYNTVSNISTTLNRAIINQNENIKNLQDDEATISSQLASNKAKIIKRLNELEGIILLETSSLKNYQSAATKSHKFSLLKIKRPIKNISRKIDQVSKYGSQKQLFILINKYKLEIIDLEIKLQSISPTLMTRRMIFQPEEDIENTITSLGAPRVETFQCDKHYKPAKIQQVQVPLLIPQVLTTFRFERKINVNRSDDILITKMGITNDNRILLCNNSETQLLVYSDQGDYLQGCHLSGRSWDIAVEHDGDIAVVTLPRQKSIQFIDIATMEAGPTHPVPFDCRSVTIIEDTICLCGYNERGNINILETDYLDSMDKVKIPNAGYITNLHPGPDYSVYYTDTECKAVGSITLKGEERFRYTSADLDGANAITTDTKGNLYVACEGSNNIQRISPNGEFLGIILNAENDIYCPTDVVFSKDYRNLFVLNHVTNNTYILVFSCS